MICTAWERFNDGKSGDDGMFIPIEHSSSSSSVKPVLSLPKMMAAFPSCFIAAPLANSSGVTSHSFRFLPRLRVVPAEITQSAAACVIESKNSALSQIYAA